MSRGRQSNTVHVVADNLAQAVENLTRDWAVDHRPRWAMDSGTPPPNRSPSNTTTAQPAGRLRVGAAKGPSSCQERLGGSHARSRARGGGNPVPPGWPA